MAGNRKVGATIALDGEKQFKDAVAGCNRSLKEMRSELTLSTTKFEGNANSLAALKEKHEILTKSLDRYQKKQEAVARGLDNAKATYSNTGKELEKLKTDLAAAEAEFEKMKSSGTATTEELDAQKQKIAELSENVAKGEEAYNRAGNRVSDWRMKLNAAEGDVIKTTRAVDENAQYLKEAENSSDGFATSIDGMGKNVKSASESLEELGTAAVKTISLDQIQDVADRVAESVRRIGLAAYEAAQELDAGYDAIIQKTGASGEAFDAMAGIANDLFTSLPDNMADIGVAVGEVNTRFGLTGETLQKLSEHFLKFARINQTDVNSSIDQTQKVLAAFGESADHAGELLDTMTKVGQDSGITMEALQQNLIDNSAAFSEMGLDMNQSAVFLGQVEKSGADCRTVLTGMTKALRNASDEGKPLGVALSDLQNKIMSGTGSMDGLSAAYDLFGTKAGGKIYNAVKQGSLSFTELNKAVDSFGGTVEQVYQDTLDPWDEIETAMHSVKLAGSELANATLGTLAPAFKAGTNVFKGFSDVVKKLPEPARAAIGLITAAGGGVALLTPKVIALTKAYVSIKTAKQLHAAASAASAAATGAETGATIAQTVATGAATVAQKALNLAMLANPVGLMVAGISGLTIALIAFSGDVNGAGAELAKYSEEVSNSVAAADKAREGLVSAGKEVDNAFTKAHESIGSAAASGTLAEELANRLEVLAGKSKLTAEEQSEMERTVYQLNTLFPELGLSIDSTTGKLNKTSQEIASFVANAKQMALVQAYQESLKDVIEEMTEAQKKRIEAEQENSSLQKKAGEAEQKRAEVIKALNAEQKAAEDAERRYQDALKSTGVSQEELARLEADAVQKRADATDGMVKLGDKAVDTEQALSTYTDATEAAKNSSKKLADEIKNADGKTDEYNEQLDGLKASAAEAGISMEQLSGGMSSAGDATAESAQKFGASIGYIVDAQNELVEVYKNGAGEIVNAEGQKVEGVQNASQVMTEEAAKQQQAYNEVYNSALQSIQGQMDLWGDYESVQTANLSKMTQTLEKQTEDMRNYSNNMNTLMQAVSNSGDSNMKALVKAFADGGMSCAGEVQAFVDALQRGDGSAQEYLRDFGQHQEEEQRFAQTMANMQYSTQTGMDGINAAIVNGGAVVGASAQGAGEGIKNGLDVSGVLPGVGNSVMNAFNSGLSALAPSITSNAANIGNQTASGLKKSNEAKSAGEGIANGFGAGVGGLATAQFFAASTAVGIAVAMGGLRNHSQMWGSELSLNFARGIRSKTPEIESAAKSAADAAAKYLHHTTPDEGPLAGDDMWGYEMGEQMATGLSKTAPLVSKAAYAVALAAAGANAFEPVDAFGGIGARYPSGGAQASAGAVPGRTVNLYIGDIKYNTDEYVDSSINNFVFEMIRKAKMYG